MPFFGQVLLLRWTTPTSASLLPRLADRRVVTYGLAPRRELAAVELETRPEGSRFLLRHRDEGDLGRIEIPLPGIHNVRNALAAIGVARALGVEIPVQARALAAFAGVHRRFERLGSYRGAEVVDDYAHHPTEVAATLAAARQVVSAQDPERDLPTASVQSHARSRGGLRPGVARRGSRRS